MPSTSHNLDALVSKTPPKTRVLSIQLNVLGIATVSRLMRSYFANSPSCLFESHWWDEDREWHSRLLRRLLVLDDKWTRTWVRRQNLDFHRFRGDFGPALTVRRLLQKQLRKQHYDVIHFHPQSLSYASLDIIRRIPTVLQIDYTAFQHSLEVDPRRRWTFAPDIALDCRLYEAARWIAPYSEWAAKSVLNDYHIDPSRVRVIYPGVDLARFPVSMAADRQNDGLVRLLFAGYDFARKGGYDLLHVFLEQFGERAELHLMTSAAVACDHPRVFVHTDVQAYSSEWLRLFAQADIFVMPTHNDSIGNVYIEAMAAGLPVIGSRMCGIPEVISDGVTGLLINPNDRPGLSQALNMLISDKSRRRTMGREGRRSVEEKFDLHKNFQAWEELFQSAASAKR